ncbi:MAG: LysO family transporter, partial [Alloprevotella sp.]|nr:LysO family transporter [Alloprevotella sp.]
MSTGLFFLLCFIVGCLGGGAFREVMLPEDLSTWLLYGLMFLVGVGMGGRKGLSDLWRSLRPSALLLPWSSLTFTLLFSAVVVCFLPGLRVWDGLAVSSGMGYYTLSSVLITHLKTPVCGAEVAAALGVTALLCNVFRELIA